MVQEIKIATTLRMSLLIGYLVLQNAGSHKIVKGKRREIIFEINFFSPNKKCYMRCSSQIISQKMTQSNANLIEINSGFNPNTQYGARWLVSEWDKELNFMFTKL